MGKLYSEITRCAPAEVKTPNLGDYSLFFNTADTDKLYYKNSSGSTFPIHTEKPPTLVANLTQTGTNAPTISVKENTIGTFTPQYFSTGIYFLNNVNITDNTCVIINNNTSGWFIVSRAETGRVRIQIRLLDSDTPGNDVLSNTTIQVINY